MVGIEMNSPTLSKKLRTENRKLHSSIAVVLFVVFITVTISVLFLSVRGLFNKKNASGSPSTISDDSSAAKPAETTEATSSTQTYKVESGDTLYAIGIKLDADWKEIAKLNDIEEPYSLSTGQELKIPKTENSTSTNNSNNNEEE